MIEFLKIEGDYAYLFDKETGHVIKTVIEDRTGSCVVKPIDIIYDEPVGAPGNHAPFIAPGHKNSATGREEFKSTGIVPKGFRSYEEEKTDLPDKPAYAPPPAALASMMQDGNEMRLPG